MTFEVRFSASADDDLERLFEFLLDQAQSLVDLDLAQDAIDAIRTTMLNQLAVTPYSFRKAGIDRIGRISPTRRELIIPFGDTGYVALYEIASPTSVVVLAVRHQREEDYH